jgi:hypothetical protein
MAKVLERSLYQEDYYAWSRQQAAELRRLAARRASSTLDLANLAEEVESLGQSDLNTVRSQLRRIIEHLLKLEVSPAAEPRAEWRYSIAQARDEIEDHLTASMRPEVEAELTKLFGRGRRAAALGLRQYGEVAAARTLPATCPYAFDQLLAQDWYPPSRHGLVDEADMEA